MEKERNYNGRTIQDDEVMVPFEYTQADADSGNYRNPDCVRTLKMRDKTFKVIYKAVPKEWAAEAKAAFNYVENEVLGHYQRKGCVSRDFTEERYELALGSAPSAEEEVMEKEHPTSPANTIIDLAEELIEKSPKHGLAFILMGLGVKGDRFAEAMHLSKTCANHVRDQVKDISPDRIHSFSQVKVDELKANRSSKAEYYRDTAYKCLDILIDTYF